MNAETMIVQKEPSISDVENWWSQMLKPTRDYETIVNALKPVLFQLNPKLVAIDGRYGTGKTTLGRYLSWRFNSTLIETDQYLSTGIAYDYAEIKRLITKRLDKKRPVFVEGIAILDLLEKSGRNSDFHIYIDVPQNSRLADTEDVQLDPYLKKYEADYSPKSRANLLITMNYPAMIVD